MAPSFNNLREDDGNDSEDELDLSGVCQSIVKFIPGINSCFADLQAQYEVRLEQGLDAFVVIDGLPVVPEDSKQKLVKFLLKKLNTVGRTKEDAIFMPLDDDNKSQGYGVGFDTSLSLLMQKVMRLLNTNHPSKRLLPQKPFMALL